jgi:hypothetical protein
MEKKQLSTLTDLYRQGGNITIYTYYWKKTINFISAFITQTTGMFNSIKHQEGYLLIEKEKGSSDMWLNKNGNLIIKDIEIDRYSIDEDGNLIYTEL